jgi:hypothetical protein
MTEAREQTSGQGTRNEIASTIPRNVKGERIVPGAILEQRGRPFSGENVGSAIMNALTRATRPLEASRGSISVAEHAEKRTGLSFATAQEKQAAAVRIQERQAADREQTQQKLNTARSELQRVTAAQAEHAKPQQRQSRTNEASQPAERKAKEQEPEMETITIRSVKDGHVIGSYTAPKNATQAELNRAAEAAGLDYRISPLRTALNKFSIGISAKDLWKAWEKAWQASEPPEATQN